MRYPRDHKQQTRKRILAAASGRFRARGYAATGVDEVMSAAGLTPGGFYGHFRSKEELLREALGAALEQTRSGLLAGLDGVEGPALLRAVVGRYLSRTHRDDPAGGCPVPALAAELAREGAGLKRNLETYLEAIVVAMAPRIPAAPGLSPEDRVLATTALLAGALLLSRAVQDEELSGRILRAARRLAVPETAAAAAAEEAARASLPRGRSRKRSPR
ncbi:MAG TPA: helix-turn-helix domain-containing protein [Myxococcales bacterium]|nr:helix-turn-helix domain-containing protein [Myxococcales bacterium]